MKNIKRYITIAIFIYAFIFSQVTIYPSLSEAAQEQLKNRFDIIEEGDDLNKISTSVLIHGRMNNTYNKGPKVFIIKDKVTGVYYIYTISLVWCIENPSISATMVPLYDKNGKIMAD